MTTSRCRNGALVAFQGRKLRASLPGVERPWAEALVAMAHAEICPYSRATHGNIAMRTAVE